MTKKFVLYILVLTFSLTTYGQKQIDILDLYEHYYQIQSETIFTHINKSSYIKGETLWFTSYIYFNKKLKPYLSTNNVYVNIYDYFGKMIDQKMFKCDDGILNGQFKINENFSPGVYYIKTTTNWMKNFNLDNSDLKQFVVNTHLKNNTTSQKFQTEMIPEGGSLIYNANNTIGIKINLKEKTDFNIFKGVVTNNSKKVLTAFKINRFGMGKFNINFNKNDDYFVTIYKNEEEIYFRKIENIKEFGLNIKVLHRKKNLNLVIETNEETLNKIVGKTYPVYIHRDGHINSILVKFKKGIKIYSFVIPKSELLDGINIITLTDDNDKTLIERIVFNELNFAIGKVEMLDIIEKSDSTTVRLKTSINQTIKNNFSISVLPETNDNFTFKENIKSKLLLSPYLKTSNNQLNKYLKNQDNESIYNLDLLLITQGFSRQSLSDLYKSQIIRYNFDTGFQIKGKLNKTEYKKGNYIEMVSTDNALFGKSKLNELNEFSIENLYLGTETELNFFLKNKKGKSLKINPYYNIYPKPYSDSINVSRFKFKNNSTEENLSNPINSFIIPEKATQLEEVELGLVAAKETSENKPLGMGISDRITFSDSDNQFQLITDVIRQKGFDVFNNGIDVTIKSRRNRNLRGALTPAVFIDNVNLFKEFSILSNLKIGDVKELYISHNGSIYGSEGAGGVINIFTKRGFSGKKRIMYKTFDIDFGFDESKPYQSPNYTSTPTDIYSQFGVINWIPQAKADSNGIITIKVPNYYIGKMKLYINGMDENGVLYSDLLSISLK